MTDDDDIARHADDLEEMIEQTLLFLPDKREQVQAQVRRICGDLLFAADCHGDRCRLCGH